MAFRLESFLATRRAVGGGNISTQKILRGIDSFLTGELKPGGAITREVWERWIKSMSGLSPGSQINRIGVFRQFCLYLSHFDPRTYVAHRSFVPRRTRPVPYIYTLSDVRKIMAAASRIGPRGSLRAAVVSTLVGLLYATGLRIGEALKLTIGDVDLKRNVLVIRETKFGKSRYVPLSSSAVRNLRAYLKQRSRSRFPASSSAPLFVNLKGTQPSQVWFTTIFLELARQVGVRGPKGQPGPRIHDLRHTFAVNRLLAWYREGDNLYAKLPLLATYLGHSTVTGTEHYLHATAELLESAGRRFHSHFGVPPVNKRENGKN